MSDLHTQYTAFVARLFNRTGDLSKDFAHAVQGIVTECYELRTATDAINATEEGGDLTFFHHALRLVVKDFMAARGIERTDHDARWAIYDHALAFPPHEVIEKFGIDLLDISKRWVGYGKEPTNMTEILSKASVVVALALSHSSCNDVAEERLMATNMAKLLKRYPGGEFDAFRAVIRDVEAERDAIARA